MTALADMLEQTPDFASAALEPMVMEWIKEHEYHLGNVMNAFASLLSASAKAPTCSKSPICSVARKQCAASAPVLNASGPSNEQSLQRSHQAIPFRGLLRSNRLSESKAHAARAGRDSWASQGIQSRKGARRLRCMVSCSIARRVRAGKADDRRFCLQRVRSTKSCCRSSLLLGMKSAATTTPRVAVVYMPFDTADNVKAFLDAAAPRMAIFVKYEFWGNYLRQLAERGIETYIISSIFRPGQIFFRPWGGLFREMLRSFTHLYVQDERSAPAPCRDWRGERNHSRRHTLRPCDHNSRQRP